VAAAFLLAGAFSRGPAARAFQFVGPLSPSLSPCAVRPYLRPCPRPLPRQHGRSTCAAAARLSNSAENNSSNGNGSGNDNFNGSDGGSDVAASTASTAGMNMEASALELFTCTSTDPSSINIRSSSSNDIGMATSRVAESAAANVNANASTNANAGLNPIVRSIVEQNVDDSDAAAAIAAATGSDASIDNTSTSCNGGLVNTSNGGSDPTTKTQAVHAPSISRILRFAVPAMGVWLCSPILSLIDTSAVGLLSGTAQQAALNPAVSVTDYGGLLVAFMYTATTNLVAGARVADGNANGKATAGGDRPTSVLPQTLVAALQLALYVGIGFGLALGIGAPHLLRALIGSDNSGSGAAQDPTVLAAALRYVRIRSLGMPAAVVIGSAQSACLGMQDIISPLLVLAAAAVVNAVGDAVLVRSVHPWIGGCAGAAWATVLSQYAALGLFGVWLTTKAKAKSGSKPKPKQPLTLVSSNDLESSNMVQMPPPSTADTTTTTNKVDISDAILELTGRSEEGRNRRRRFRRSVRAIYRGRQNQSGGHVDRWTGRRKKKGASDDEPSSATAASPSRGVLANQQLRPLDLFRLPPLDMAQRFAPFVVPVTTTAIGRISGYLAMSHVASSALGTVPMAAQAVILSFFCVLTPICDSLNLTAQSFVPAIYEEKPSRARADALRQTLRNFSSVGAMFGAVLVAMVAIIPALSRYFTADMAVRSAVNEAIPGLSLFFALSGLVCVGEGMLLGQKDLRFLGRAYGAYFFAVPYFLLRLKKRALLGLQDVGVGTMWRTFSFYQVIRCCIWFARMTQLQRRTDRNIAGTEVSAEQ